LHLGIDRIQVGENADPGVMLGDTAQGVRQGSEPAIQLAELAGKCFIFLLKSGGAGEVGGVGDRGISSYEDKEQETNRS
jgi:hypothetical protein